MKLAALALCLLSTEGCAVVLGAHVREFQHQGVTYVKCTIVADKGQPAALSDHALQVCKDALGMQTPEPQRRR